MAAPVHRPFGCPRVLGRLALLADRKTSAVAPRRSPRGVVTSSVNLLVRARPLVGLVAALANAHGTGDGGRAPYQAPLLAVYPTGLSLATYSYFFGGLLMLLTGAFICNNFSEWAISTSDLAALMCAGVITSALNYGHLVWSKKVLGPALMALYYPLQPVASAILSRIFLGSSIYMGRFCPELLLFS